MESHRINFKLELLTFKYFYIMRKFLLALLIGVFTMATMVAEPITQCDIPEAPDIVMQIDMDAPAVVEIRNAFEVQSSTDVGWQSITTNIIYTKNAKFEMPDNSLYRYDANSISYMPKVANNMLTANDYRLPDIPPLIGCYK
jgi:hypothetical protein